MHINHAQFRSLNPQTGRWWQIDPMAEKFYVWSGYNYTFNNPLKHTDPDGRSPWYVNEKTGEAQWRTEDVTAHIDENNTTWWNEGNTIEGVNALGHYVRGNEDGTTSNEMPAAEITGSRNVSWGEKASEAIGYDIGVEFSVVPQLGFSLGKTDVQVGGNLELVNLSLVGGWETISGSNVTMNIFAEAQKSGIGGGFETTFSGPVNRIGQTLSYEAGGSAFNFVGQVQGTMGPGVNTHGVGGKWESRQLLETGIGIKAFLGMKITLTQLKK